MPAAQGGDWGQTHEVLKFFLCSGIKASVVSSVGSKEQPDMSAHRTGDADMAKWMCSA